MTHDNENETQALAKLSRKELEALVHAKTRELERMKLEFEQKVMERTKELERAYKELQEVDRLKSEFIDVAAHELRTPLTPAKIFVDLVRTGMLGEINAEQGEKLRLASESIRRTSDLIMDMLDLSKMEARKIDLRLSKFTLTDVINDVLRVLAPQIDEKGHTIVRKLPDNLPTITADRTLIGRALKNVISNAIEYTQDLGKIIIDAEVTRGTELHIKIIDNGIGIPPDAHEKIFEKFYRVPGVRERSPGGFGLGLAITKYIIERHNGKIWVESTPGVGSAFHILLPIS